VKLTVFPGGDLVERGLADRRSGRETVESLLVEIGAPRLSRLGFEVPVRGGEPPEHRLYRRLASEDPRRAHSRYNAFLRRLSSFQRSARCAR
jgi:hypothetical protein